MKCWCGVVGETSELCKAGFLEETCGGTGSLHCFCGGDQCVCHFHGQVECDGCPDCESEEVADAG